MKKIACLLLMFILAFSMVSCGGSSDGGSESRDAILEIAASAKPTKITTVSAYVINDTEVYNGFYTMTVEGNDSIFDFSYERRATVAEQADGMKVTVEGVVYYKDGLYSRDGEEWDSEAPSAIELDFNLDAALLDTYTVATNGNSLTATVTGENIKKVLGSQLGVDGAVTVTVITNGTYLSRIEVEYKTAGGATVSVDTTYTYDQITLEFPGEEPEDSDAE